MKYEFDGKKTYEKEKENALKVFLNVKNEINKIKKDKKK